MIQVLHTHIEHEGLFDKILHEVLLESLFETLKLLPFLFLTYLLMEFIEHKASGRTMTFLSRSGKAGPAIGGVLGAAPQCAFSAVAANLYTGRVITLGTLIAVFISTSDEMLPIMLSGNVSLPAVLAIIGYKVAAGMLLGFCIDILLYLTNKNKNDINIDEICENDNCHCERGIIYSSLHHTLTVGVFILIVMLAINTLFCFVDEEAVGEVINRLPVLSHLCAAFAGLIPGCAVSVAMTTLGLKGIISTGTMISGLCSGAGVGLLVLIRLNRKRREIFLIAAILVIAGTLFGIVADLIGLGTLIT